MYAWGDDGKWLTKEGELQEYEVAKEDAVLGGHESVGSVGWDRQEDDHREAEDVKGDEYTNIFTRLVGDVYSGLETTVFTGGRDAAWLVRLLENEGDRVFAG